MPQKYPQWKIQAEENKTDLLSRLLQIRQIPPSEQEVFLHPDFDRDIYDPKLMKDMDLAVTTITGAIENKKKILIHGDYDCDGVCATAIIFQALQKLGAEVDYFLPDRERDGYGLNLKNIEQFASDGVQLVVTVDCGISNHREIKRGYELGLEFIITDHHALPLELPICEAILLPRAPEDPYPEKSLCGAAVAWKLSQALFEKSNLSKSEQKHHQLWSLDLVALASVADCVPLRGENRTLVYYGIKAIEKTHRLGLQQLKLIANIKEDEKINSDHLGYRLAPRINAAGRLEHPRLALELLLEKDKNKAKEMAQYLNEINNRRQEVLRDLLEHTEDSLGNIENEKLIYISSEDFHSGIVGLIAGRLTEKYHRPSIVAEDKGDLITASCRSIAKYHITENLQKFGQLMERYGGHREAAGFTVKKENISKLIAGLKAEADKTLSLEDLQAVLSIDTVLSPAELTLSNLKLIEELAPFGIGNPSPLFAIQNADLRVIREVGKDGGHFKLGFEIGGQSYSGLYWNGEDLDKKLKLGSSYDLAITLQKNEWNGNVSLEFIIRDMRPALN